MKRLFYSVILIFFFACSDTAYSEIQRSADSPNSDGAGVGAYSSHSLPHKTMEAQPQGGAACIGSSLLYGNDSDKIHNDSSQKIAEPGRGAAIADSTKKKIDV